MTPNVVSTPSTNVDAPENISIYYSYLRQIKIINLQPVV